ncbi:MAG: DNA-protecting protein DprA [Planctomycetes bacterium]|nr:DNA-protecting protein DprA [Planctomycetota bacterium]
MRSTLQCDDILGPLDEVERYHAPKRLYLEGDAALLQRTVRVAVVGSRDASALGLRRARRISTELARERIVVVSGLARGVDHAAHTAAIEAGGRTIAVIGTPLDRVYPPEHAELQAEFARAHLVVSQFGPKDETGRWSFPERNRTMALLSHATVIVEAGDSSGTLHQAWEALRLGRPTFFMRSLLEDTTLAWPRKLLDHGAQPLASVQDVLDEVPFVEVAAVGLDAF